MTFIVMCGIMKKMKEGETMIRDCQNAMKIKRGIISHCENIISNYNATREDLIECSNELNSGKASPWYKYQSGYISRRTNIDNQPVKINRKSGLCYVLVPCRESTYYCYREYYKIDCEDFVEWLLVNK